MRLVLSTRLRAPADAIWDALQKSASLRYVTSPLLGFRGDLPECWSEAGEVIRVERLMLFGLVPAWGHEIRIVHRDDERREVLTSEKGGPVTTWNHRIHLEPLSETTCRYTDEVEIRAGRLTPLVWLFGHLFYRYRQMRWRTLAPVLR